MNNCLSDLTATVKELTSLYQNSGVDTTAQEKSVFLSQLNLEEYFRDEEKFTQQLHAYTKKQFFEVFHLTGFLLFFQVIVLRIDECYRNVKHCWLISWTSYTGYSRDDG